MAQKKLPLVPPVVVLKVTFLGRPVHIFVLLYTCYNAVTKPEAAVIQRVQIVTFNFILSKYRFEIGVSPQVSLIFGKLRGLVNG